MKGQISVEFLASMFIFLLATVLVLGTLSNQVPTFKEDIRESSRHLEATTLTNQLLSKPGRHSYGSGGQNWQKNQSTRSNVESIGLASDYLVVEEDKLENISTVGNSALNYTNFLNTLEPKFSYSFTFTWMPIVDTYKSFKRGSPPSKITEPSATGMYGNADEKVHYGDIQLHGNDYHFLVTSHKGRYNTTYISDDWDFSTSMMLGIDEEFELYSEDTFEIASFQNRPDRKGTIVVLQQELKRFGSSEPTNTETSKINRYAAFNASKSSLEPLKIEVLTW